MNAPKTELPQGTLDLLVLQDRGDDATGAYQRFRCWMKSNNYHADLHRPESPEGTRSAVEHHRSGSIPRNRDGFAGAGVRRGRRGEPIREAT